MASRSWNRVELIGNMTRDPELRYTPNGAAVCTIGIATNRSYVVEGERKEEVDFHRIIAWNKLAELCNQLLKKGSRVFMSGRLQYREWETNDGQKRRDAEIVLEDMIQLTPKATNGGDEDVSSDDGPASQDVAPREDTIKTKETKKTAATPKTSHDEPTDSKKADETVDDSDLPF